MVRSCAFVHSKSKRSFWNVQLSPRRAFCTTFIPTFRSRNNQKTPLDDPDRQTEHQIKSRPQLTSPRKTPRQRRTTKHNERSTTNEAQPTNERTNERTNEKNNKEQQRTTTKTTTIDCRSPTTVATKGDHALSHSAAHSPSLTHRHSRTHSLTHSPSLHSLRLRECLRANLCSRRLIDPISISHFHCTQKQYM